MKRLATAFILLLAAAVVIQATAVVLPAPLTFFARGPFEATSTFTLNTAGNYIGTVGQVQLANPTGSKACTPGGGCEIYSSIGDSIIFANGTTTLRIGIGDVGADGLFDGTMDVYAELVGGTDTLTANIMRVDVMESGTKTLAQGDLIFMGGQMPARGGADQVRWAQMRHTQNSPWSLPYGVGNAAKNGTMSIALALIRFDDDSYGWIQQAPLVRNHQAATSTISFNTGSATDEYAGIVSFSVPVRVVAIGVGMASEATTDPFEVLFYTTPLGTPAVASGGTCAFDADVWGVAGGHFYCTLTTPQTVAANTTVGVALRPTSANNLDWQYFDLLTGLDEIKSSQPFASIIMAGRANQTGAFVTTQVYHVPDISFVVDSFEGTAAAGGGSFPFVGEALLIAAGLMAIRRRKIQ